ncbi:hypothetical protein FF38_01569 [Lucilia cuprina]|uniref:Uncharacterized protein n=1 Tax=Lucilia cuprina TaxID=7375 RepID=A0A0L0CF72_LUCCU|nr:hypothetical protein FF38_01569 [Lucilia cuprina]
MNIILPAEYSDGQYSNHAIPHYMSAATAAAACTSILLAKPTYLQLSLLHPKASPALNQLFSSHAMPSYMSANSKAATAAAYLYISCHLKDYQFLGFSAADDAYLSIFSRNPSFSHLKVYQFAEAYTSIFCTMTPSAYASITATFEKKFIYFLEFTISTSLLYFVVAFRQFGSF